MHAYTIDVHTSNLINRGKYGYVILRDGNVASYSAPKYTDEKAATIAAHADMASLVWHDAKSQFEKLLSEARTPKPVNWCERRQYGMLNS